ARVVLRQNLLFLIIDGGQRGQEFGAERAVFFAVDAGPVLIDLDEDVAKIVGLAVDVFTQDQDALVGRAVAKFAKALHAAARLSRPGLSVVAKDMIALATAEDDGRGPHLADDDLAAVLDVVARQA